MSDYNIRHARRDLYSAGRDMWVPVVPAMNFLVAYGKGNLKISEDCAAVVEKLYIYSYAIRALVKKEPDRVRVVGPLEGTWSVEDLRTFRREDKNSWE